MDLMTRRRQIMMAASPLIEMTATGNPAVFTSKARKAYTSLKAGFLPVQDLHGYDHPWPGGGGNNQWDEETESGALNTANGTNLSNNNTIRTKNFISVLAGETYKIVTSDQIWMLFYDSNKEIITDGLPSGASVAANNARNFRNGYTCVMPTGCAFVRWYFRTEYGTTYKNDTALNYPSTASTYAPYSNICPITGWTGMDVTRTGKNLFDKSNTANILNDAYLSGATIEESAQRSVVFIPCKPNRIYTASRKAVMTNDRFAIGYTTARPAIGVAIKNFAQAPNDQTIGNLMSISVTTGNDAKYVVVWAYWGNRTDALDDLQLELGSTATAYEPYTGTTVSVDWTSEAGTVYGGYATVAKDGSVTIVVDRIGGTIDPNAIQQNSTGSKLFYVAKPEAKLLPSNYDTTIYVKSNTLMPISAFDISEDNIYTVALRASKRIVFNVGISTLADVRTWFTTNTVSVIYPLETPVVTTLTAQQIQALLGTNVVFSDANDNIEVKYLTRN